LLKATNKKTGTIFNTTRSCFYLKQKDNHLLKNLVSQYLSALATNFIRSYFLLSVSIFLFSKEKNKKDFHFNQG